jgi:hypothetical protein
VTGRRAGIRPPGHGEAWTREPRVRVRADRQTVFRLLAEIELWPAIIPHIRSAQVIRRRGPHRLLVVRASWYGIPIGWRMVETVDPAAGTVALRHLSPLTRGSAATWTVTDAFASADGGRAVDLVASQQVRVPLPVIGGLIARRFVGGMVARAFGQAILNRVKEIAEGASLAR